MRSNHGDRDGGGTVRMELKYCEHCGGLWVREGGAGVYCEQCQPKVANLPIGRKKNVRLTVRQRAVVEDYDCGVREEKEGDFEAAGGVA